MPIPVRIRLLLALSPAIFGACASPPRLPATYADHPHWQRYLPSLPDSGRALAAARIVEERWGGRGDAVHVDRLEPAGRPKGTVILVHGGGGNGRLIMSVAPELAASGWRVVAPDLPGYGLTTVLGRAPRAHEWAPLVRDLAVEWRARSEGPVFLFGMSVGSWVAYNAAALGAPVDGLIVSMLPDPQSGAVRRATTGSWWTAHVVLPLGRLTAPVTDRVSVPLHRLVPLRAMSADTSLVRTLRDDPLIGSRRVALGLLRSMTTIRFLVPPEAFRRVPVLIVHPGADVWTPVALTEPVYARLAAPKRLVVLEGGGHFPVEPGAWSRMHAEIRRFLDAPALVNGTVPRAP